MTDTRDKCEVRDGRFVEPCDTLSRATDVFQPAFSKGKGVFRIELTDRVKRAHSRTYFGIRTKEFSPGGILLNFCPFCGSAIDAPFSAPEEGPGGPDETLERTEA